MIRVEALFECAFPSFFIPQTGIPPSNDWSLLPRFCTTIPYQDTLSTTCFFRSATHTYPNPPLTTTRLFHSCNDPQSLSAPAASTDEISLPEQFWVGPREGKATWNQQGASKRQGENG